MWNDSDYGVYGQGDDGYIRYSQAMDLIREQEESRKALMDEFDSDYNSEDHDYGNCHSSKMISDKSYTSITPKKDSLHEKAHQDYVLAVILLICSIFLIVICLLSEYSAYPADSGSTPAAVTTPKRICVRKDCDREAYKDFLSCSLHCPRQLSENSSADKNKNAYASNTTAARRPPWVALTASRIALIRPARTIQNRRTAVLIPQSKCMIPMMTAMMTCTMTATMTRIAMTTISTTPPVWMTQWMIWTGNTKTAAGRGAAARSAAMILCKPHKFPPCIL